MPKRVMIAGLLHETHTFVPGRTRLEQFHKRDGAQLWQALGDSSTLAGALAAAQACAWEVIPVIHLDGGAGPLVADAVVEAFWDAFLAAALAALPAGIDGIFLDLHGAMVSESYPDVEGELLRRMREQVGLAQLPIGGVLDLHGNISLTMAQHSTALLAYQENPHSDAYACAVAAVHLLHRLMLRGEAATTVWAAAPLLLPPDKSATADEPMRSLEQAARALERNSTHLLAVNVFAGFPYADIVDAGVSFTAVTTGDPHAAQVALQQLCNYAMDLRNATPPSGVSLATALATLQHYPNGPVLLVEPADNIGGGAPGDNTLVLQGLLAHKIERAGVILNDPVAVQQLAGWAINANGSITIGGASAGPGAEPLLVDAHLLSRSTGQFTLEDQQSHQAISGRVVDMGPCAVIRVGGVIIMLTSRATPPFDLAQWRSQGINPESFAVINIKAAVAHRRAYDPIAAATIILDTPGVCASDLRHLPYQHVRRPIYPLDA
jgi:microcystin degradation protein MlrC